MTRSNKEIRNIQKYQDTYYVTIPKDFIRELGWREHQKVVVKKRRQSLTIKDWPIKKKT